MAIAYGERKKQIDSMRKITTKDMRSRSLLNTSTLSITGLTTENIRMAIDR